LSETPLPFVPPSRRRHALALIIAMGVILLLSYLVFRPFLIDIAVAGSVALMLYPVHLRLTRTFKGRAWASALLLTAGCLLALLMPIFTAVTIMGRQAVGFVEWSAPKLQPAELQALINERLPERYPWVRRIDSDTVSQVVSGALSRLVSGLNQLVQGLVGRLTSALLDMLMFAMLVFFFLKDGPSIRTVVRDISPLSEGQERDIFEHLGRTVKGVVQAMLLVPLAQGLVAAPAFAFLGVPSPLLWSFGVVLAAFVPILGSPLGWIPAVIYLFFNGASTQALILLVYGIVIISGIDNVVKPMVLRGAAQIHPLLAFLATIGGLLSFGAAGFLIGPMVLSLLLSALKIYTEYINPRRVVPSPSTIEVATD
jgi:predicted PurR-regulated permease PerM